MPHSEELPMPESNDLPNLSMEYDQFHKEIESSASGRDGSVFKSSSAMPKPFALEEKSDRTRDLNFSKATEILVTRK